MLKILKLIGRQELLFSKDISKYSNELLSIVCKSKFLVIGGAGSIGQAVVKEIFKRNPKKLPNLIFSKNTFFNYTLSDFVLENYNYYPAIKAKMNV